jgi:ABC-2 type transport system permease protein
MTSVRAGGETLPRRTPQQLKLILHHARLEVLQMRRSTEAVVSIVAIPPLLYAMFAMSNDSTFADGGASYSTLAVGSFAAYGVLTLTLFAFGSDVARERGRGWLRTLRATPVPLTSYVVAKLAMGVVYAALILASIAVLATIGEAEVAPGQWLGLGLAMIGGVLAFSSLGFAIAFLARPRAASAVATLAFLPLSFVSGFFIPLSELPEIFSDVAPVLPTYHFGQLVWHIVGTDADAAAMSGLSTQSIGVHVAWVTGMAVVGLALAVAAGRREAVTRRS